MEAGFGGAEFRPCCWGRLAFFFFLGVGKWECSLMMGGRSGCECAGSAVEEETRVSNWMAALLKVWSGGSVSTCVEVLSTLKTFKNAAWGKDEKRNGTADEAV